MIYKQNQKIQEENNGYKNKIGPVTKLNTLSQDKNKKAKPGVLCDSKNNFNQEKDYF